MYFIEAAPGKVQTLHAPSTEPYYILILLICTIYYYHYYADKKTDAVTYYLLTARIPYLPRIAFQFLQTWFWSCTGMAGDSSPTGLTGPWRYVAGAAYCTLRCAAGIAASVDVDSSSATDNAVREVEKGRESWSKSPLNLTQKVANYLVAYCGRFATGYRLLHPANGCCC